MIPQDHISPAGSGGLSGEERQIAVGVVDRLALLDGQQEGGLRQAAQQLHTCHRRWKVCQGCTPLNHICESMCAFFCDKHLIAIYLTIFFQLLGQTSSNEDDLGKFYFYLAFENSICKDYVTEKFFRGLQVIPSMHWTSLEKIDFQAPVVPVVLGGANYSAIAPNHSFIHVDDFARCLQILVGFPPKDLL